MPVLVVLTLAAAAAVGSSAAAAKAAKPSNRARPRIVGTPRAGVTLTATHGAWTPTRHVHYQYRWLRCPAAAPKCTRIAGAHSQRYIPASRDVGVTLRVTVTAVNSAGSTHATSRPTRVVQQSTNEHVDALWHMDETSGALMHDAAGKNDGTLFHVTVGLPGSTGTAYGFNGSNSYVSVPSANDLNPGTANITLTVHLKTTAVPPPAPADYDLIRKGTYAPTISEYKMEFQHTGQVSCGFEGSAGYSELIAGPRLNDGHWHKVQCIKAPTAIQLVVDGKTYTQSANVGLITNTAPVVIGARPDGDHYSGALDEVSIQIG